VVSLGTDMVGIIHPCKVYGAMAIARPFLYLGPPRSHITDLLDRYAIGWKVSHGDVDGAAAAIEAMRRMPREELSRMGTDAAQVLEGSLSQSLLCGRLADAVEATFHLKR